MKNSMIVEASSGNVFADLGYPSPEEALAKSRLAQRIAKIIERDNLTHAKAAAILGVDEPKIATLIRGHVREFSTEQLFRFLNALNQDVEIVVRENPERRRQAMTSVVTVQ